MPDPQFESRTARLALPLLFAGQSQRETFVNEGLARLDFLVNGAVEGESAAPPVTPQDGECWLVAAGATGAWSGRVGAIACFQQGQWLFQPSCDGLRILNRATGQALHYHGGWHGPAKPAAPTGGSTIDAEARVAINAVIAALVTAGILPS